MVQNDSGSASLFNQQVFTPHVAYIDIAGDLIAGILLSQIMYWFTPTKDGKSKVSVFRYGHYWIAKRRDDWYNEIRITAKQYDRAVKILEEKELIESRVGRFDGYTYCHVRPLKEKINEEIEKWEENQRATNAEKTPLLPKGEKRISPKVKSGITQRSIPLTETTTKTTTENTLKEKEIVRDFSRETLFNQYGIPMEINMSEEIELIFGIRYFINRYKERNNKDHRKYKEDQWKDYMFNISLGFMFANKELTEERMKEVIDYWFDRKKVTGTMEFAQFAQSNMIKGILEVMDGKIGYNTVLNKNREMQFV